VSIAWAVAEHLHDRVRAKTLFATHYHELCALADLHPRVRNVSVAAREWKGDIVFPAQARPGGASRSFGIEVGKLAGLPGTVVERARAILKTLESDAAGHKGESPRPAAPAAAEIPSSGCLLASPWASPGASVGVSAASRRPPGRVNGPLRMRLSAVLRASIG